ncbi:MAG: sugar phosphate isomerase/epimerase [Armatimonadetes bacterium]|nr:sugar phosphate isomerase/epimerase [Armatimonadota bacterium]MDE2207863.1 sugar phosphate isomerase/epimerase [Armatimonadota bacterium]
MKIGIFTALFHDQPIEAALDIIAGAGIRMVEFGGGAYPGDRHLNDVGGVQTLIDDEGARRRLLQMTESRGLGISAISVHGNPIHPNAAIGKAHHEAFRNAVVLANRLGVGVVNGFSGCPAGPNDTNPNWVTCPWPDEYRDVLAYQWNQVAIPYWREQNAWLAQHNVRFAIEAHPGFIVYNPETVIKLRDAAGEQIGCNFDPSHFWWQGIDPLAAVRYLGKHGAIFHVHAKDTRIDPINSGINGNLDVKSYGDIATRSWVFRSVGYGHGQEWWNDFVTNLRMTGYDDVLSIEHEDGMMSTREGLTKALETLKIAVVNEKPGAMFWAKE